MDRLQRRFLWASLACFALAGLVIALALSGVLVPIDEGVLRSVEGSPAATLMRGATFFGDGLPRSLIAAGFILFLMIKRYQRAASYILYTTAGIAMLNAWVFKALIARARPEIIPRLIEVDQSFSLPSGHAANSAAVYGAIALVAGVIWWRNAQRRAIWAVTALLVLLIGLSRIWLGVHWPSDVLAGWLVGAGWALLLAALLKPVKARAPTG